MVTSLTALRNRISLIYGYSGHKVQNGTLFVEGLQASAIAAADIEDYEIESTERGTLWHLPSRTSASVNARVVPRHYLRFEAYCRERNIPIESVEVITPAGSPKTPRDICKIMEWQDCTSKSQKSQKLLSIETYWYCYTLTAPLHSYNPTFFSPSDAKHKVLLRRQESKKDQRSKLAFLTSLLKLCSQIILDPGLTADLVKDWEEEWCVEFKKEIERIAGGELSW